MIIGFVAPKEHGKTTACNIIKKHLPDVVQINFKDALVEELKEKFPDLLREIRLQDAKEWNNGIVPCDPNYLFRDKPPLIRTLMQNYGSDVRRADDIDYWLSGWVKSIRKHRNKNTLTDDVRFLNEANLIRGYGGILIRLERTDLEQTDTHLSETEQKEIECDYTITCGAGELDKLEAELIKILDSVQ